MGFYPQTGKLYCLPLPPARELRFARFHRWAACQVEKIFWEPPRIAGATVHRAVMLQAARRRKGSATRRTQPAATEANRRRTGKMTRNEHIHKAVPHLVCKRFTWRTAIGSISAFSIAQMEKFNKEYLHLYHGGLGGLNPMGPFHLEQYVCV